MPRARVRRASFTPPLRLHPHDVGEGLGLLVALAQPAAVVLLARGERGERPERRRGAERRRRGLEALDRGEEMVAQPRVRARDGVDQLALEAEAARLEAVVAVHAVHGPGVVVAAMG